VKDQIFGYLNSNVKVTPGEAGNYFWALVYILLLFLAV